MEQMKDVYIVQCLMETDLYKLLKTQVSTRHSNKPTEHVKIEKKKTARIKFSFPGY